MDDPVDQALVEKKHVVGSEIWRALPCVVADGNS